MFPSSLGFMWWIQNIHQKFVIFKFGLTWQTFSLKNNTGDIFQVMARKNRMWRKPPLPLICSSYSQGVYPYPFPTLPLFLQWSQDEVAVFPLGRQHIYRESPLWLCCIITAPKEVDADQMELSQLPLSSLPVSLPLSLHRGPQRAGNLCHRGQR